MDGTRRGLVELRYIFLTVWRYKVVVHPESVLLICGIGGGY